MKMRIVISAMAIIFLGSCTRSKNHFEPHRWAFLNGEEGKRVLQTYHYSGKIAEISYLDIWNLEDHFKLILPIRCASCQKDTLITDLEPYAFQFTGVMMNGRKFICINAFARGDNGSIANEVVLVADGGKDFWHALYDINNKSFSKIEVNEEE